MVERIRLNVGGQLFITKTSTLQTFPKTKLGNVAESCEHFDEKTKEYFFDRNPTIFQSILDYYRTGKLHFVSNVCAEHIRQELDFWGITTTDLGQCCWKNFYAIDSDLKTVAVIEKHFFSTQCHFYTSSDKFKRIKNRIWNTLENPRSSKAALVWQLFYLFVVCFAIILSILQSFELSRKKNNLPTNNTTEETVKERLTDHDDWVAVLHHVFNLIFTFETTLRLVTCPWKLEFLKSFLNIVDIVSVVGYFVFLIVEAFPDDGPNYEYFFLFTYIMMVLRGFRFFRLERFIEGLRLMMLSMKQSKKMLCLLILVILITAVIFGITIHVLEMDGVFSDPIRSFYWAIITMTTVGYGDIYPKTPSGHVVASACAIVGLCLLSMPIAVVANTFTDLHCRYSEQRCHKQQQRRITCCNGDNNEMVSLKF